MSYSTLAWVFAFAAGMQLSAVVTTPQWGLKTYVYLFNGLILATMALCLFQLG